jgi:hypothetical protein
MSGWRTVAFGAAKSDRLELTSIHNFGCRDERPDAGLAVPPRGRQVVGPLAGHDVLNEDPDRPSRRQRPKLDGRSDRRG